MNHDKAVWWLRVLLTGCIVVPITELLFHGWRIYSGIVDLSDLVDLGLAVFGATVMVAICLLALRSYSREKVAQAQLHELEARMHHSRRIEALGRLTAGVAHDFNNLLTVVIGNAEQIIMLGDPQLRMKADNILTAATRGARLVAQMLTFSRRQIVQVEPYNLDHGLKDFTPMIASSLKPTVTLEMHTAALICHLDRDEFELATLNIVNNADQAMPSGGRLTICVEMVYWQPPDATQPARYARIAFEDTGTGMPDHIRERAFEPFFTTYELGAGLGLSQVYGFAKQAGGEVAIDSQPGHGTTVVLYLPMNNTQPETLPKRIVVVDDQSDILGVIGPALENSGYVTFCTDDPQAALRYIDEHPVEMLLTDVVMPTMMGNELATRVVRARPQTKVLMMTGFASETPGFPVVRKPFRMADLLSRISALLNENPDHWAH